MRSLAAGEQVQQASRLAKCASLLGVLLWGVSLFALRRDFRRIYGGFELLVAVIFANSAVDLMAVEGGVRGALQGAAAVYLMVRALDNLSVGHRAALDTIRRALDQSAR